MESFGIPSGLGFESRGPINSMKIDSDWIHGQNRIGLTTLPNGQFEERVKVDRKKFEQLINGEDIKIGSAEDFFKKVMSETNTEISWPPKLKAGTKSKKDPHIRIVGTTGEIQEAKEKILICLDSRRNRVTLKMDVAFTDHSHIIGKGGRSIQKVMDDTGCHIHFPDSNRTNAVEKSNQVTIAGTAIGSEQARCRVRELLPLTFIVELPSNAVQVHLSDSSNPTIQAIQQTYSITISMRMHGKLNVPSFYPGTQSNERSKVTLSVRGSRAHFLGLKQGLFVAIEYLTGSAINPLTVPLTLNIDIASQHHAFVLGRANINIRNTMQKTGSLIVFPEENHSDPASIAFPARKSTVTIKGANFDSVYYAWQELLGYLPLILIFDLREGQDVDPAQITQLMDELKVSILVKPKQKQNLKSIMVRGMERESRVMFEVRRRILDLDESEVPVCCDQHAWFLATKFLSLLLPYYKLPQTQFPSSLQAPSPPVKSMMEAASMTSPNAYILRNLMNRQNTPLSTKVNSFANFGHGSLDMFKKFEKQSSFSSLTPTQSVSSPSSSSGTSGDEEPPIKASKNEFKTYSKPWPETHKFDYEEHKLLAAKVNQEITGDVRIPTSIWSGFGFSKSMPDSIFKAAKFNPELTGITESNEFQAETLMDKTTEVGAQKTSWETPIKINEQEISPPLSQSNYFDGPTPISQITKDFAGSIGDKQNTNHSLTQSIDLALVLSQLGLSKHLDVFQWHEIDFSTFLTLNDADLQELGIAYFGRRKLLNVIVELKRLVNGPQVSGSRSTSSSSISSLSTSSTIPAYHFEAAPGAERSRKYQSQYF